MAIKIHYGPNGTYKTSGAIWDDVRKAALAGRTIVTNIRGMSTDRVMQVIPEVPDSFKLIWLDMEDREQLQKMGRWFHWMPKGALLVFDEAQTIFRRSWRDKDLEEYAYPGGMEKAKEDERPFDWLDAWTRHRHWGWDMILTTQNLKLIRSDIREVAEVAYQHRNAALLGALFKGRYRENVHSAMEAASASNTISSKLKKVNTNVFKLYDSTATGTHTDTIGGVSIFSDVRLLLAGGVLVACIGLVASRFASGEKFLDPGVSLAPERLANNETPQAVDRPPAVPPGPVAPDRLDRSEVDRLYGRVAEPYQSHHLRIGAHLSSKKKRQVYFVSVSPLGKMAYLSQNELQKAGYQVEVLTECLIKLTFEASARFVHCENSPAPVQAPVVATGGGIDTGSQPPAAPYRMGYNRWEGDRIK